jgi:hypothetical protein
MPATRGLVALVLKENHGFTPPQVEDALKRNAEKIRNAESMRSFVNYVEGDILDSVNHVCGDACKGGDEDEDDDYED